MNDWWDRIYNGNAKEILATLPAESVDMCITSPPYWSMRDYGTDPVVWGGDPECDHDFLADGTYHDNMRYRAGENTSVGNNANPDIFTIRTPRPNGSGGKTDWAKEKLGIKDSDNFSAYVEYDDRATYSKCCSKCGALYVSLGLEPTFDSYINNLCDIFEEVRRVLKPNGSLYVNLGDAYASGTRDNGNGYDATRWEKSKEGQHNKGWHVQPNRQCRDVEQKSLCLIPFRFSIEMMNRGWICRNVVIWHKKNCMPASCKDRFTVDFEYLFFFTKSKRYYFEQQFEPMSESTINDSRFGKKVVTANTKDYMRANFNRTDRDPAQIRRSFENLNNKQGRNMRTVWSINTKPCDYEYCADCGKLYVRNQRKEIKIEKWVDENGVERRRRVCTCGSSSGWVDHFASFNSKLIEVPIRASCPQEICNKCGKPRESIYRTNGKASMNWGIQTKYNGFNGIGDKLYINQIHRISRSDCGCGEGFHPGVVLDLFMGSGTTALEAIRQGKRYVGIDLNGRYCKVGEARAEYAKEEIVMSWMGKRLYAQMAEYGTGLKTKPGEPIFSIADCMILSEALGHYDHAIEYCHIVQEKKNIIKPIKRRMTEITENQLLMF